MKPIKWNGVESRRTWVLRGAAGIGALAAIVIGIGIALPISFLGGERASVLAAKGPMVMRRLTPQQYQFAVSDIFGPDIKIGGRFEPLIRDSGLLEVGAGRMSIGSSGLEQYANMARTIAWQALDKGHRAAMVGCTPVSDKGPDDRCAAQFLSQVGLLVFRRPLGDAELKAEVAAASVAARTMGNFYDGLAVALAGMLEAPQFLFSRESAVEDRQNPGRWTLDAYSKASRLSFLIWDSPPDGILLKAAAEGRLDTRQGLKAQVDRLLTSTRVERGTRAFFSDMMGFDGFDAVAKDPTIYPKYNIEVVRDVQEQTLRTIADHLLTDGGDYRDLFTTPKTFLSKALGPVYGVPVPAEAPGMTSDGWMPYTLPDADARAGILGQPSFLSLHSHPGRSSPTLRGKALREIFLCQKVPDPPGNVNFKIVQDTTNPDFKTARQRLTAHRTSATCAGCHKIMDPVGLAMDNYDSIGSYRSTENGAPIDPSGEIDGVRFGDAAGLGKAVHDHPATAACLVNRLFSYAVGRTPSPGESEWIKADLEPSFSENGYRWKSLLRHLATSEAFFQVSAPARQPVQSAWIETVPEESGR